MFGYVTANTKALCEEELKRYRAAYCGLCSTLRERCSELSRFALRYDMAFLVLLLDSLYDAKRTRTECRCIAHPLKKQTHDVSENTLYAADMTVLLTYYKCLDDWEDEKSLPAKAYAGALEKAFIRACEAHPREADAVKRSLETLSLVEHGGGGADDAARAFGALTGAIFSPMDDMWHGRLESFGNALGRFIYIMDAWDDAARDAKHKSYNPFAQDDPASPGFNARSKTVLQRLMGDCAEEFEKLPLVEDIGIMRNAIYSGVWSRFDMKTAYIEKKERRRSNAGD